MCKFPLHVIENIKTKSTFLNQDSEYQNAQQYYAAVITMIIWCEKKEFVEYAYHLRICFFCYIREASFSFSVQLYVNLFLRNYS